MWNRTYRARRAATWIVAVLLVVAVTAVVVWAYKAKRSERARCPTIDGPVEVVADGTEVVFAHIEAGSIAKADLILEDRWPVERFEPVHLAPPLSWDGDPYGEKYWRFVFYGMRPLRHLVTAYVETGDARYRDKLIEVLEGFVADAPCTQDDTVASKYLFDPHTAANRAMILTSVYVKLAARGDLSDELGAGLLSRLAALGAFLADPAKFEVWDNHGVTEAGALLVLAHTFEELPRAAAWKQLALARLDEMAAVTVDSDGAQIEQSPAYHFYVLAMFEELRGWAEAAGVTLPPLLSERIPLMLDFAGAMTHPDRTLPRLGASNRLTVQSYPALVSAAEEETPEAAWLLSAGAVGVAPSVRSRHFPVAGFTVLRSAVDSPEALAGSTHVVVDIGPYRTAHSDLDALSLVAFGDGVPLLIDGGLYSLEKGPWRDYFHGTRGHNTVVVDGVDQRKGTAVAGELVLGDGWTYQTGWHALYDGVVHRRAVAMIGRDVVVVLDELDPDDSFVPPIHDYTLRWHVDSALRAEADGQAVIARDGGGAARLALISGRDGGRPVVVRGAEDPIEGWQVESYEKVVPADVVVQRVTHARASFATLILIGPAASAGGEVAWTGSIRDGAVEVRAGDQRWVIALGDDPTVTVVEP